MIIKASQRGGAMQLATHLLNPENEHVTVHEVRGFVSDDLPGAMKEAQLIAAGTRARQHLFSVSLNPPAQEDVRVEVFETTLDRIERDMGLDGQPRAVVFHEKEGRRHCHAVWSRIDAETMTARQMSHFKFKMRDISRDLYFEHGWKMPNGLMNSAERDSRNFDLSEWQQMKRIGRDPRQIKGIVQECWAVSDSRAAFAQALESRGMYLARGDKRSHVALTYEGEAVSIARMIGRNAKTVRAKLGDEDTKIDDKPVFRSVAETRAYIAETIAPRLGILIAQERERQRREAARYDEQRIAMRDQHERERQRLDEGQRARTQAEGIERAARLRGGLRGLWDRMSGEYARQRKRGEMEAYAALLRDREQRDAAIFAQLRERRELQRQIGAARDLHAGRLVELHGDLARQREARIGQPTLRQQFAQQEGAATPQPRAGISADKQAMLDKLTQGDAQEMLRRLGQSKHGPAHKHSGPKPGY